MRAALAEGGPRGHALAPMRYREFYATGAIIALMFDPADAPDPDLIYANYLKTCEMNGVEPVSRERAGDLVCVAPERF